MAEKGPSIQLRINETEPLMTALTDQNESLTAYEAADTEHSAEFADIPCCEQEDLDSFYSQNPNARTTVRSTRPVCTDTTP